MSDNAKAKAKVIVYGAEWCPPCHTTKSYLKGREVAYKYVNIDEEPEQGRDIAQKTGWTAIPIIQIGDEYILGFDRPKIDTALKAQGLM
ncbi:MAG TPA: glutaredoxin family protein [Candidatus Saccharimonadales bacterium]|nr:glutaredoxin family protein [Candidatus Saccharimonadales bacterium]